MGYRKQTLNMPLAAGVNTKPDPRALQAPGLAVARDVQFDELGGLQTRKPFASLGSNILGGGTLSNVRRVVSFGEELLCFTSTALYSWSASDSAWVSKGTYLAVKAEEKSVFTRTSEQTECDRAELNNVVVYAWKDAPTSSTSGVYVAAADKTTGAVLLAPTAVGTSSSRPRLLALTSVIHLYYVEGTELKGKALTTTSLSSTVAAAATTIGTAVNSRYDACVVSNSVAIAYRRTVTTSYEVKLVTAALVVTASTKARTCDGSIAIAYESNNTRLLIARGNGNNVQADQLNASTLADVHTATAVGSVSSSLTQITAAFRSVADSGAYRCYIFYSKAEIADQATTEVNYVDTANATGTESTIAENCGIGSRAFDHSGSVYVWLAFALESTAGSIGFRSAEQNSYFMLRDDGTVHAKAAWQFAGGYQTTGFLPGVQSLGSNAYAWCGAERRIIPIGVASATSGYSARGPRDVKVTFDSDDARRCTRLGETLYISGGVVSQYDGEGVAEVGFLMYPCQINATDSAAGNIGAGTYTYKATYRWDNAKGERERSTTATTEEITKATTATMIGVTLNRLSLTAKTSSRSAPAVEIWRTAVNPTIDSPFYLITSQDPSSAATENEFYSNSVSKILDDNFADSTLTTKEINPENGGILENLSPPAAAIIAATLVSRIAFGTASCAALARSLLSTMRSRWSYRLRVVRSRR
jgi:hypothetical protein